MSALKSSACALVTSLARDCPTSSRQLSNRSLPGRSSLRNTLPVLAATLRPPFAAVAAGGEATAGGAGEGETGLFTVRSGRVTVWQGLPGAIVAAGPAGGVGGW
ncbi:hypothetical protein GCM10009665_20030 [Kitasatospora nipponensis]|uniref:Cyclic nucleotide-binding domain-containing protein n=1 Tax=Kitasatospora nipponensis TaxID=258049 RepID=A0ABP4GTM7_9ACTN